MFLGVFGLVDFDCNAVILGLSINGFYLFHQISLESEEKRERDHSKHQSLSDVDMCFSWDMRQWLYA